MKRLEPPDTHYLSAAVGWLELGNPAEAKAELASIRTAQQEHPDVLEVRWLISAQQARWEEGLQIARSLLHLAPDRSSGWLHQAYALRRVENGSVKKAWDALLPAAEKFPREPVISYNLSCYACQMRQLDAARALLKRAAFISGREKIKRMALEDPDLQPLWDEIRKL
jgi:predicted Zn-dependent protease